MIWIEDCSSARLAIVVSSCRSPCLLVAVVFCTFKLVDRTDRKGCHGFVSYRAVGNTCLPDVSSVVVREWSRLNLWFAIVGTRLEQVARIPLRMWLAHSHLNNGSTLLFGYPTSLLQVWYLGPNLSLLSAFMFSLSASLLFCFGRQFLPSTLCGETRRASKAISTATVLQGGCVYVY